MKCQERSLLSQLAKVQRTLSSLKEARALREIWSKITGKRFWRDLGLWVGTAALATKAFPGLREYEVVGGAAVAFAAYSFSPLIKHLIWRRAALLLGISAGLLLSSRGFLQTVQEEVEKIRQARIPTERRIWDIDLLRGRPFEYFVYAQDVAPHGKGVITDNRYPTPERTAEGLRVEVPGVHAAEISRSLEIPRHHLGKIYLFVDLAVNTMGAGEPAFLYLLRQGRDPIALDTFSLKQRLARRYDITAQAGDQAVLSLRISTGRAERTVVTLRRCAIESRPTGGTVIVHTTKSWDGGNLNGNDDDFWYRVQKLEGEEYLLFRKIKMAADGFTKTENLPPGNYRISAVVSGIVLGDLGEIELTEEAGWLGRFSIPLAKPFRVQVLRRDGVTPLAGADILVETNAPEGGPIRGGEDPRYRILTDENGLSLPNDPAAHGRIWLYPAMNPEEDFYVIRVKLGSREVGNKPIRIGRSDRTFEIINVVTNVGSGVS